MIFIPALSFAVAALETWFLVGFLRKRQIFDIPNSRSNHKTPTPRGGGIAIADATLVSWIAISLFAPEFWRIWPLMLGAVFIALVSFMDDIKPLSVRKRLLAQFAAACAAAFTLTAYNLDYPDLPRNLSMLLTAAIILGFIWFMNIYNFMDGIDGISAVETFCIGLGVFLVSQKTGWNPQNGWLGLSIAAAALGFGLFNWHPAKIFMGDVGSVFLGCLLFYLLADMAISGYAVAAVILPLYYLTDSGITLFMRVLRKERFWEAHSQHFYQKAVRLGFGHSKVSLCVLGVNIGLIIAAYIAS